MDPMGMFIWVADELWKVSGKQSANENVFISFEAWVMLIPCTAELADADPWAKIAIFPILNDEQMSNWGLSTCQCKSKTIKSDSPL